MNTIIDDIDVNQVSEEKIAEAKSIGKDIFHAMNAMERQQAPLGAVQGMSLSSFTDFLTDDLKNRLKNQDIAALEARGAEFCSIKANESGLMTSKFGCAACTTGLYIGIAALIGGAVVLTGGLSIAAVAAASGYSVSGLAVVISAMTGVSTGAVSAIIGAGQVTLGVVVVGLCESMGKC